jgi:hypothetical protein
LNYLEKIKEVGISVYSTLSTIEYHKNKNELSKQVILPLLFLIEILKYAIIKEILLIFLVNNAVVGDFDTDVLEDIKSKLEELLLILIFCIRDYLLVHI